MSQKRFMHMVFDATGKSLYELGRYARLEFIPDRLNDLYFDEADKLVAYCFDNFTYLLET
jgi:hypothetical protein